MENQLNLGLKIDTTKVNNVRASRHKKLILRLKLSEI